MYLLNADDERSLNNELLPGESVLWSGKPNLSVILHASDWGMIPFSLVWAGFTLFWEAGVSGIGPWQGKLDANLFMTLWGAMFVVIGQYMVWGRFVYAAWKKTKVVYVVTNRRAVTVVRGPGAKSISTFLNGISLLGKDIRADGIGTIRFGAPGPLFNNRRGGRKQTMDGLFLGEDFPVFVDINGASEVFKLVSELRARL